MFKIKNILILIIVIISIIGFITLPFINKVYLNIYVANTYLGDKTKTEGLKYISEQKLPEKVTLLINGQQKEILTSEIIKDINYQNSIDRAYNFANSGNFIDDLFIKIKLIFNPVILGLSVEINEPKLTEVLLIISAAEGNKPVSPSVKIAGGQVVVDPGKNGVEIDMLDASTQIKNNLVFNLNKTINISLIESKVSLNKTEEQEFKTLAEKLISKNIELIFDFDTIILEDDDLVSFLNPRKGFDDEKIKQKIVEVSRKINRNPQNSVFIVNNEIVTEFTPSKDGITVNEDELVEEIKSHTTQLLTDDRKSYSFEIPVVKFPAKIKTEDVNNLGISTLLGKGVSHFAGSIPNRIHNVNLAQSKFKGILVPPNETFSFNSILGDVSAYTGYKAAYVIKDGKTVLGDGGGVCQVSTTLFRAVLSAGLLIIERRPHSYRVGYYEQGFAPGLDATVYYPTTDLKFKNDTGAYLLIQPSIDNSSYTLTFEIYGTNDGRVATVSKPIITSSIAPLPDLYVDDPTLKTGVVKQIEHKAWGAKVIFDYKVTRNGEELINQKFISNYRPWQAVYLRGTANQ